jgi:integrase
MIEQKPRRTRRPNLTDKQIAALSRKRKRYTVADPEQRNLYLRVPTMGPITYAVAVRDQYGKKPWVKVGSTADMGVDEARERARTIIRRIKDGLPAFEPVPVKPESYTATAQKWLQQYVVAEKGLRTRREIERLLRKHVLPFWGKKDFVSIRRRDINDLLDAVASGSGPWTADHVLPIIRKIATWYATRTDDYVSPFVPGMRRTRSEERARDRILTDDELRKVWKQAEAEGTFGALIRTLLLTAQRRGDVVGMKWSDIKDDVWEIPTEPREKGHIGAVRLPDRALAIIQTQPHFNGNDYVFAAARGNGPLAGFSKFKADFDRACGISGWTLHDLRRTSRSLMSRAGVTDEHAEHAMGHKLGGVKKIYNRYDYFKEKSDALVRAAALIEFLINPLADNVMPLQILGAQP